MKALSISQPWASLVLLGAKRFETRGWHTAHRGPLGIHAAKRFRPNLRLLCSREPVRELLRRVDIHDWSQLPRGALIGTVDLAGCTRIEELPEITDLDRKLGDFQPGRWAWRFCDPCPWPQPFPAVGRLGVFEISLLDERIKPADCCPAA